MAASQIQVQVTDVGNLVVVRIDGTTYAGREDRWCKVDRAGSELTYSSVRDGQLVQQLKRIFDEEMMKPLSSYIGAAIKKMG